MNAFPVEIYGVLGYLVLCAVIAYLTRRTRSFSEFSVGIIPAIAVSALGYCIAAAALSMAIPRTAAAFWIAVAMSFGIALGLHITMPHQAEPGHRSPLPLWRKLPIIVAVLAFVVIAKQSLQGFIAMFPI